MGKRKARASDSKGPAAQGATEVDKLKARRADRKRRESRWMRVLQQLRLIRDLSGSRTGGRPSKSTHALQVCMSVKFSS
jgi:hypothetical protein